MQCEHGPGPTGGAQVRFTEEGGKVAAQSESAWDPCEPIRTQYLLLLTNQRSVFDVVDQSEFIKYLILLTNQSSLFDVVDLWHSVPGLI